MPSPVLGPLPVPAPGHQGHHGPAYHHKNHHHHQGLQDDGDDDDAPSLDIGVLSRSLISSGSVLEPELQPTALPAAHSQACDVVQASERSPLLGAALTTSSSTQPNHGTRTGTGTADEAAAPLYLNGTSTSRFWLMFSQVLSLQFMACFDTTIMASSHPVITSYFGAANSASWLSTAFLLTSTACQPLLGRLSDAVGRKPLFLLSIIIFVLATLACALASSIHIFIAARALCGLGAGGGMALGSIIVSDLVPIERRGSYQSYLNIVFGFGSSLGVALGGAMAEALGWRWEFGVQIPPLLVCLCVSALVMPNDLGILGPRKTVLQAVREFDTMGSIMLTTAITFLILGLTLGGNVVPWSHPLVIASLVIFVVCCPVFVYIESRALLPIMPLHLITRRPRANLVFSNLIAAFLTNAVQFNIPLYFQAVLLMSATESGLRLVLPTLASSAVGASTGFAIAWTRRLKWPLVCGSISFLVGTICLTGLRRDFPSIFSFLAVFPTSIGAGFLFPGSFISILASSQQSEQAVVTATLILWRSVGYVLGVAVTSLILQNALVYYLELYVRGEGKRLVIDKARSSVEAVAKLDQPYREQVVKAYEDGLRWTFGFCILVALVSFGLVFPIKLARLPGRRRGTKSTRGR